MCEIYAIIIGVFLFLAGIIVKEKASVNHRAILLILLSFFGADYLIYMMIINTGNSANICKIGIAFIENAFPALALLIIQGLMKYEKRKVLYNLWGSAASLLLLGVLYKFAGNCDVSQKIVIALVVPIALGFVVELIHGVLKMGFDVNDEESAQSIGLDDHGKENRANKE